MRLLACCVLGVAGWMLARALSYIATYITLALLPLPPGWFGARAALCLGQRMLDISFEIPYCSQPPGSGRTFENRENCFCLSNSQSECIYAHRLGNQLDKVPHTPNTAHHAHTSTYSTLLQTSPQPQFFNKLWLGNQLLEVPHTLNTALHAHTCTYSTLLHIPAAILTFCGDG